MIENVRTWADLTQEEAEELIYTSEAKEVRKDLRYYYEDGIRDCLNEILNEYLSAFVDADITKMGQCESRLIKSVNLEEYLLDGSWADFYGKEFIVRSKTTIELVK